ncbi:MAG TPA: hypothetical protein VEZ20_05125 [Allosphingosinicella sp.]|jgi:Dyp-type peroxidase family|nr:hypothetical protein [Allosphingosinicella sp.]
MGQRPVTPADWRQRPNWKLKAPLDAQTQAIVVSGFASLPTGRALFLNFGWEDDEASGKGAWLKALAQVAPITDADGREARVSALAFTYTGIAKTGLPPEALQTFTPAFREGMYQEDRLRRLGDKRDGVWQPTVIPGGPKWSGNIPVRDGAPDEAPERASPTDITVHALLMIYEKDDESAEAWTQAIKDALAPHGVTVVHCLHLELRLDDKGIGREHFGFADGVSQPVPFETGSVTLGDGDCPKDYWHGVPLGEVLLGHVDAHHETPTGPVVPIDTGNRLDQSMLSTEGAPEGFLNFGTNGSYMVVRELKQDVAQFWQSMEKGAAHLRERDPNHTKDVDAFWMADRVVGRNMDGAMLCPAGFLASDQYGQPQNEFGFFDTDYEGHGCPPGSHVRRANPRDALAPNAGAKQNLLDAANNHRILRRGRKYGTTLARGAPDDGKDRGLLFICLNTDIARQFEFVQQTWLLNSTFATLYHETDPLIGPPGKMTIREKPLRRIVDVETFVQLAGGEYFFLPSMPAIRYLEGL